MKKILVILLIFILILGMVGCSNKPPEGIENKEFYKDLTQLIDLNFQSAYDKKYYKDEIDIIINKLTTEYQDNLNEKEVYLLNEIINITRELQKDINEYGKASTITFNKAMELVESLDYKFKTK